MKYIVFPSITSDYRGQLDNDTWRERKEKGGGDQTDFKKNKILRTN